MQRPPARAFLLGGMLALAAGGVVLLGRMPVSTEGSPAGSLLGAKRAPPIDAIPRGALLLVTAESGDMVLVQPVPEEHRELTRFSALRGKTWNPPALAGEYLVVRNDKEAACYRLPLAKE